MAEESTEEKTEAPSDKRRQESREKGSVAKSTEINSVLILLTSLVLFKVLGPWITKELTEGYVKYITAIADTEMTQARFVRLCYESSILMGKVTLPVIGGIMIVGVFANVIQIGLMFTFQPLMPKFEKINPISGFKRLFSMRSIVETVKSIAKLVIIGYVAYTTIKKDFDVILLLSDASIGVIWGFTVALAFKVVLRITLVLIIIAILDYAYQRYDYEQKLKMSHQEVKEEHKQMEGDPMIKSRIKALQREMARRRMMEEVPKATVVVTNPTHIAIALRYEPSEGDAPVVIAKGKRIIAERIKKLALDNDIPIIEDKPLARAMYDKIDVGLPIPMEFFTAIAEIMAYVYRLKNRTAA